MENHNEMSLSEVRKMIIRYGAKYMEQYESDLYYDCNSVGKMQPGDSVFWMVSATHTYMYSAKEIHEYNLNVGTLRGNRFNYRIDCMKSKWGDGVEFDMTQVFEIEIQMAVNEYQKSLVVEGRVMDKYIRVDWPASCSWLDESLSDDVVVCQNGAVPIVFVPEELYNQLNSK